MREFLTNVRDALFNSLMREYNDHASTYLPTPGVQDQFEHYRQGHGKHLSDLINEADRLIGELEE